MQPLTHYFEKREPAPPAPPPPSAAHRRRVSVADADRVVSVAGDELALRAW